MPDSLVAAFVGALSAMAAVGAAQWLTYAREEASRLRREKKETAAQALAAWRDYNSAREMADNALATWDSADNNFAGFLKDYQRDWSAVSAAEAAEERASDTERPAATAARERAARALERTRFVFGTSETRVQDLGHRLDSARTARANAERQVEYCTVMLELACAPEVVEAYSALTSAWLKAELDPTLKGREWKIRDAFTLAVRKDIERVSVRSCLWNGTAQLPWTRSAATLQAGSSTLASNTSPALNTPSEASL